MEETTTCTECSVQILLRTARRNGGLCVPCVSGTRADIEKARQYYKDQRAWEATDPLRLYWKRLISRVHDPSPSDAPLSDQERIYYALRLFEGELFNGGLQQFFFNSSGDYFRDALRGLDMLHAESVTRPLLSGSSAIFGDATIPVDTGPRRVLLAQLPPPDSALLGRLNQEICAALEELGDQLDSFGRTLLR